MAGLFDWLTEGMGALGGGGASAGVPPPDITGGTGLPPPPQPPMPPVQQTGADMAPINPPKAMPTPPPSMTVMGDQTGAGGPIGTPSYNGNPATTDLAGGMQGGPPPTPAFNDTTVNVSAAGKPGMTPPPIPAAAPRPVAADGGTPPGPPTSLAPPLAPSLPPEPNSGPQAHGILGRALGLDPNREAQIRGSLGAGLTAAAQNSNKPGLAAFAGGMGGGITGGKTAEDKITADQQKYISQALIDAKTGDERALNVARTRLALAQAKQTEEGKGTKESIVNSEQQLYLRAQSAAAQDGRLKALKTQADQASTQFGPESPQAKAALKAHKDLYDATVEAHLRALGVDPAKAGKLGKQPGMSADNPLEVKSNDDLAKAQPGMIVKLPNGDIMRKKQPAAPQQPGAAPVPAAPVVTAPAGSLQEKVQEGDDE